MKNGIETAHHSLHAHEVVLLTEADAFRGLKVDEIAGRRQAYGLNVLPRAARRGFCAPPAVSSTIPWSMC